MRSRPTNLVIALIAAGFLAPSAIAGLPAGDLLVAQAGAGLVQPEGLKGLAKPARPNMVEEVAADQPADAPPDEPPAVDEPAVIPDASPLRPRYLVAYALILAMISGGTFLVARPSGRKIQKVDSAAARSKGTAANTAGVAQRA